MKNKDIGFLSCESLIAELLSAIGDNSQREGLKDTPTRVAKMWKEIYKGYDKTQKPSVTTFSNNGDGIIYDQMIMDTGYFYSQCEHHLVPFFGEYYFSYVPDKKILGLSKVARIVDFYSAKLQVQERLGKEILDELEQALRPKAIGLVLKARHLCKEMRGVKKINGEMTTSDLRGLFKKEPETRAEFMSFVNRK
jgi:GTP cyclohydrolase I